MKTPLAAGLLLLIATRLMAETWPTLDQYVGMCDLIVLCETELVDDQPRFKVVEEWKGKYRASDFSEPLQSRIPKPGYLPAGLSLHSGRQAQAGQKVVFFFTPAEEKYSGSSTTFDVRDGKLVYAETSESGLAKEYTLEEFKRAVLSQVESDKGGAGQYDADLTRKIAQVIREVRQIEPGMTRADLLKVFTTEGGTSNRKWRRYVHRRCPYIKVDVEFQPVGDEQNLLAEKPADKIEKISERPFLEFSIMD